MKYVVELYVIYVVLYHFPKAKSIEKILNPMLSKNYVEIGNVYNTIKRRKKAVIRY